jgi:competence ComEA-like helix-hairpin-helix protein
MKRFLKLAITLSVLYVVVRQLTEYLRPTRVSLDEYVPGFPPHPKPAPPGPPLASTEPSAGPSDRIINLNEADVSDLTSLPGIGPALAGRIVSYRNQFGSFSSVQELSKVRGIGSTQVERLRPLVMII